MIIETSGGAGTSSSVESTAKSMPVVSTGSTKAEARNATTVADLSTALLDTLTLLDQMQSQGKDPARMRVNGVKPKQKKKWKQS